MTLGVPLAVWVLYLVASGHDMSVSDASGNSGTPFAAYAAKWGATVFELRDAGWTSFARFSLMGLVSLTTQAIVLVRLGLAGPPRGGGSALPTSL